MRATTITIGPNPTLVLGMLGVIIPGFIAILQVSMETLLHVTSCSILLAWCGAAWLVKPKLDGNLVLGVAALLALFIGTISFLMHLPTRVIAPIHRVAIATPRFSAVHPRRKPRLFGLVGTRKSLDSQKAPTTTFDGDFGDQFECDCQTTPAPAAPKPAAPQGSDIGGSDVGGDDGSDWVPDSPAIDPGDPSGLN